MSWHLNSSLFWYFFHFYFFFDHHNIAINIFSIAMIKFNGVFFVCWSSWWMNPEKTCGLRIAMNIREASIEDIISER